MHKLDYEYNPKEKYTKGFKTSPIDARAQFAIRGRKPAVKKKPFFVVFASFLVWTIALSFSTYFNKQSFLDPVYINRFLNKNLEFDTSKIYAPTLNYINNLSFLNSNILTGVPKKGKAKVVPIKSAGELHDLANEIKYIISKYPKLHAGVYIYDYKSVRSVEINSDEVFPSASIIKIPILINLFNMSKMLENEGQAPIDVNKKLTFTEAHRTEGSGQMQFKSADVEYTIDYLAKVMMRQSDNSATNMLIEYTGGINELNASLRHWGFSKTQVSSFLPDLDGTNTTTPKDIATMLYNIDNQLFLPIKYSAYIKDYMTKVDNRTLLQASIPNSAVLVHKTGDIGSMLGDAGIVYAPNGNKFIMVVMVKRPHNDYSAKELIQKAANAAYKKLAD